MNRFLTGLMFSMAALAMTQKAQSQDQAFLLLPGLDKNHRPIPPSDSEKILNLGRAVKGRQYLDVFVTPRLDTLAAVPDSKGPTTVVWGLRDGDPPGEVRFDTNGFDFQEHYYAVYNDNRFEVVKSDTVRLEPYDRRRHGRIHWQLKN
jgi:hypothetical protein